MKPTPTGTTVELKHRRISLSIVLPIFLGTFCPLVVAADDSGHWRVIDPVSHHLGIAGKPERQEFEGKTPEGSSLEIKFTARANARPATLLIRQRDVKFRWPLTLNGKKLGTLQGDENPQVTVFNVQAGALRDGENILSIRPPLALDDIFVGDISLDSRPPEESLHEATIRVRVTEKDGGAIPCRLTIVDTEGCLAPVHANADQRFAVRAGVIYTGDGHAEFGLPAGSYTLYAGRGFEYGVAERKLTVAAGGTEDVTLQIAREVPTPGLISSDTHLHTLTFSGHGDAAIAERMLTIAGEGIELPIATDHNHHTDYSEEAVRAGVQSFFTPVPGNEVTTKVGHFNAFPIKPGSAVVDDKIEDWPALMKAIRATPGVQVVTLNHPRDLHSGFIPFGPENFNTATGAHQRGELSFDALEVITSGALQSDFMRLYRDWFALLNRGVRIAAIASSDTHDVSRFILGQGRTYVVCDDRNPGAINFDEVWRSFREGRVYASLGLLTQMTVEDRFTVGDLATGLGPQVRVKITVLGPSWTHADRLELFANGVKIREQKLDPSVSAVEKARVTWSIPKPFHDVHLVAIASGPGVTAPYWNLPRPYQPDSPVWVPHGIGSTNPIWLDCDGDGKFTSAREYAKLLIRRTGTEPQKLLPALAAYDEPVAVQAAELCHAAGCDLRAPAFATALGSATEPVRKGFATFSATLPAQKQ